MKNKTFTAKEGNRKKSQNNPHGVKKKRKWIPEHKVFKGSVKEGEFLLNTTKSEYKVKEEGTVVRKLSNDVKLH